MSFLGRSTPPFMLWAIIVAFSNALALPLFKEGQILVPTLIEVTGLFLLILTVFLWWVKGWSF